MDEPTAPLSNSEIESLFAIIGEMKKSGISIIYISHRMDEIKRICDRATILRDGQYISTVDVASTSLDDIIAAMVGRKIAYVRKGRDKKQDARRGDFAGRASELWQQGQRCELFSEKGRNSGFCRARRCRAYRDRTAYIRRRSA